MIPLRAHPARHRQPTRNMTHNTQDPTIPSLDTQHAARDIAHITTRPTLNTRRTTRNTPIHTTQYPTPQHSKGPPTHLNTHHPKTTHAIPNTQHIKTYNKHHIPYSTSNTQHAQHQNTQHTQHPTHATPTIPDTATPPNTAVLEPVL